MAGAGREIGVVEIIWLDPARDEGTHQLRQHVGVVVDAPQQHRLAQHRNAGIDDPPAGGARRRRQFAGMIGVEHHIGRLALRLDCRTMSAVMRSGATAGTRVWMRTILTWSIAASVPTAWRSRDGGSTSGSPPVRMTSQICGWARI
jgi:hypothetical protein